MEIALTWDLVVLLFFIIIMAYSYIVGQNGTIKIVLSSYIAMLCANGIGNLIARYIILSEPVIQVFATSPEENIVIFKMLVFVSITLMLVLKGSFTVDVSRYHSFPVRFVSTTIFGFLSAGLILSTVLVFMAGTSIDGILISSVEEAIDIPHKTLFVDYLILYYNFWFAAPAIAFVLLSLLNPNEPRPLSISTEEE